MAVSMMFLLLRSTEKGGVSLPLVGLPTQRGRSAIKINLNGRDLPGGLKELESLSSGCHRGKHPHHAKVGSFVDDYSNHNMTSQKYKKSQ